MKLFDLIFHAHAWAKHIDQKSGYCMMLKAIAMFSPLSSDVVSTSTDVKMMLSFSSIGSSTSKGEIVGMISWSIFFSF